MKAQDIVVLIKLNIWNQGRWKIVTLAKSIFLSQSETHGAIKRLKQSGLFDPALERPKKSAMQEFLIHGLKYCFPAEIGAVTRGVPTSHAAPEWEDKIVSSDKEIYVWPYAKGKKRGPSLKPLYKTAPEAALEDPRMYHYLALIDVIRIGKAREQAIAKEELVKLIKLGNEYEA